MAAVAAAAITAAVAAGTTAYSASQAGSSTRTATGKPSKVPLPPYAAALNKDVARVVALNMGQTPPSFAQYVGSGGTAKFPFIDPGMTPQEREQLGLVGPKNTAVPFQPRGSATQPLTLQQILFEGTRRLGKNAKADDPISRLARASNKLKSLQATEQTPRKEAREAQISGRIGKLKTKLGVDDGSTG